LARRALWIWVVAAVAPLVTIALAVVALLSIEDVRDQTASRLAGKEVEGKVRPEGVAAYIRNQMGRGPQHMVVLGDSLAHSDLHHEPLAKHLDLPPRSIARISIPGSGAPTWYAILDNHVFGPGHRPEWVVVVASVPSLMQLTPSSPAQHATLRELMDDDDVLLHQRLDDGTPSLWTDLLTARVKAKQLWTRTVRGGAVGWLYGRHHQPDPSRPLRTRIDWGTDVADRASARVFDRRRLDLHQRREIIDTVDPRLEALDLDALPSVADSWLPHLVALCREHGARLALVKPPVSPTMPPEGWDQPDPDLGAQLHALGDEVVWLDDSRLAMSPNGYRDEAHMAEALARRYAMLVGARLARITAGDDDGVGRSPRTGMLTHPRLQALPPTRPARPLPEASWGLARTRRFDLTFLKPAADRAIIAGMPFDASCLPLQVRSGDQVVPRHPDGCWGLMNDNQQGTCFDGTHLWVRTQPEDAPIELVAHPTGRCEDGRRWMAAGERLRWTGLATTEVTLTAVSPMPLGLQLVSGPPPMRKSWTGRRLERHTFALPRRGPAGTLELRNPPAGGPVLLLEAFVP